MSWTDTKSIGQILKLRDLYNIKTFIETGTFRGVNAEVHALNFQKVITCELITEYYEDATKRLNKYVNVTRHLTDSSKFLKYLNRPDDEIQFIYLDAHFYDPNLKPEDRWVVLKELKALKGYTNCVIVIHDFDNGELGHLTYDGQTLDFDLMKDALNEINPNFHYYTNTLDGCNIINEEDFKIYYPHIEIDDNIKDNLWYVWTAEEKTYRGILYCTPTALDLHDFELRSL